MVTQIGIHRLRDMFIAEGVQVGLPDGRWVRAVPEPYTGNRWRAAWWVLTGRAHAMEWPKPGDLEDALWPMAKRRRDAGPANPAAA